jgi:hypothetical protein
MTRRPVRSALAALAALALLAGCERTLRDMYQQPRLDRDAGSPLFDDGKASRPPPPGSIPAAVGDLAATSGGRRGADELAARDAADAAPSLPPLTRTLLLRGQDRFDVFCAPCHSPLGDGDGLVVRRGFPHPPSFHQARLREAPDRLRRDDAGLRRDAVVCRSRERAGPLGDRRLRPRPAAEPGRALRAAAALRAAGTRCPARPRADGGEVMHRQARFRMHGHDAVAVLALLLALPGLAFAPALFFASWLAAWWFCVGLAMGAQANCWMQALTGGR